jgi:hypothetical protein
MMNNRFRHSVPLPCLALVPFVFWLCSGTVLAQLDSGRVVGSVKDSNGAAIGGAVVQASSINGLIWRQAISSASGSFEIPGVPVGKYDLSAQAPGFKKYLRERVSVDVNQESRIDIKLQPGELSETVTVREEGGLVQSTTSVLGKVVDENLIVGLPLNGRNFYDLGLLQTGIVPLQPGRTLTQNAYNVNGARDTSNNFLLDGVANQELEYNALQIKPAIDALSEFKIQTNLFSAEFGRNSGAVVNAVIRSGSADFHSTLWEFLRNDALDARNFFSPTTPRLHRNQFGGTLGGPMGIPKLFRLESPTFFFVSYEGLRQVKGLTSSTVVPTAVERNGNLSNVNQPIIDPQSGLSFPGNVIPPNRISNAARALLNHYPLPNVAAPPRSLNFTASPAQSNHQNQFIVRVDHSRSVKTNLFGRYIYDNAVESDPFQFGNVPTQFPGFAQSVLNKNQNLAVGFTRVVSPEALNDFRFGFSRTNNPTTFSPLTKPKDVGIDFNVPDNVGPTDVRIGGFSGMGNSIFGPSQYVFNTFQLADTVTLVRGRNAWKVGGDFRKHQENTRLQFAENGQFLFNGVFTGDALADFLLGRAFYFTFGEFKRDVLHQRWGASSFFIQDDLRITPKLTLNLGVRYEYVTPIVDNRGSSATILIRKLFTPGIPQSGQAETVLAGSNGLCDKCTYLPDKNNWGPRVGFAYDVFGNGRLAVRGGYGVFFNQLESNLALQNVLQPPFASFPLILDSGGVGYASLDNPTCGGGCVPPGAGLALVTDPHLRMPYMQHFNVNTQYEFLRDWMLEVGYVGTLGRKLLQFRDLNQPIFIPGTDATGNPLSTTANKEQRRPYAGFSTIAQSTTYGTSSYNGLQASVNKRFSHGYTFLAGYTFAKSIDLSSQFHSGSGSPIDPAIAQDANNLAADAGLSSFDMRHRFTLSGVFELPFGPGKRFLNNHGLFGRIMHGWSLSPILVFASGVPLTVRDFTDPCMVSGPFITSCRPNLLRNPNLAQRSPERWFDTAAFVRQPAGTFGSAGRNILFADGAESLDLAVVKHSHFGDPTTNKEIEFRVEVFNLANHPQFGPPDLDFSSPTFGRVFSTARGSAERQIQFGLKVDF